MKPLLLITNDDGIESEGLRAAAAAAVPFGDVLVAAPLVQQTSMGRAYPKTNDLGIIEPVDYGMDGVKAFAVHGTPGYCAAYGILELADRRPDLLVSGINFGCNLGLSLTASGTMGAAFEAFSQGISALAVSLETDEEDLLLTRSERVGFQYAAGITGIWIEKMLSMTEENREGDPLILNVNIPSGRIEADRYRVTFLENQNYYEFTKPPERDQSRPFPLTFSIRIREDGLHDGSDIQTVCRDRITSVTPITMDMTKNARSRF